MKIEMQYVNGMMKLAAVDEQIGVVAVVEAENLKAAAKALVSRFHEMQQATIDALRASGVIHYVTEESLS